MLLQVSEFQKQTLNIILFSFSIEAVISGNFNRLEDNTRAQIETMTHKDKLVIVINRTEPEIMKQVVIFMYTAKCDLDESNGMIEFNSFGNKLELIINFFFFHLKLILCSMLLVDMTLKI